MISSCDSGSMPFKGDSSKFLDTANRYKINNKDESVKYFEINIVKSFLNKIRTNIEVPNYPQFRDMNDMFISMIDGIEKIDSGYIEIKTPSLKKQNCRIPEVMVIEQNSKKIYEQSEKYFQLRICITGPYTLASFFPYKDEATFTRLGNVISEIVDNNLFSNRYGKTTLVSIDEPLFGLIDDPLIDFGSKGRETLLKAWEKIFQKIKSKNAQTMIHLHSTTNHLFWDIPSLLIIDSHVDDPFLDMKKTGELLELKDKFLKASITVNDFDILIKKKIISNSKKKLAESIVNEKIANVWKGIKQGKIDSEQFLEPIGIMSSRLTTIVNRFGMNRVLYAGPECGLMGYPLYENALECLKRVSTTVKNFREF
ncbi:hypothetical protein KJN74_00210 [Candidatus Bathyarchaeota archaeon]|nr:hypothetical protein [Candidatus Bathyarchaeota archaeon]